MKKDRLMQAIMYTEMRKQGMSPLQAYQQAFPEGLEFKTQEDINREAAKDQQKGQLGGLAGILAGTVGTKLLYDQVFKEGGKAAASAVPEALGSGITESTIAGGGGYGAAGGGGAAVAAPTGVEASFVPAGGSGTVLGMSPGVAAGGALAAALALNNLYEGGVKDIAKGKGDSADWTNTALNLNPMTAPINIGLKLLGKDSLGKRFKTGKHEDQLVRDDGRNFLQAHGVLDDNDNTTLADGSAFNLGRDGRSAFTGMDGNQVRQAYEVDASNPLTGEAVGEAQLLGELVGRGNNKLKDDFTGQFANAAMSNAQSDQAGIRNNLRAQYQRFGIEDRDQAYGAIDALRKSGRVDDKYAAALQNAANNVFGQKNNAKVGQLSALTKALMGG